MITSKLDKRTPEVRAFHPLVEARLQKAGLNFKHEVLMPDNGRVDFMVYNKDGSVKLIECKPYPNDIPKGVIQVVGYRAQIFGSSAAVATSKHSVSKAIRKLCQKHNVELIQVEAKLVEPKRNYFNSMRMFLETYMFQRGLTAQKLAKELGVANSTIGRILYGQSQVSVDILCSLSKLTGTNIQSLIDIAYPQINQLRQQNNVSAEALLMASRIEQLSLEQQVAISAIVDTWLSIQYREDIKKIA